MSFAMAEEVTEKVTQAVGTAANGRMTLNIGDNLLYAVLGYLVVFIGLSLLMFVIVIVGKIMVAKLKKPVTAPAAEKEELLPASAAAKKNLPAAPGTAGEVKIYDTDPRDAAMIMAIVADKMQKPLNELRFVSIKEVK